MPITTYLTENERETWKSVHDKDLNDLFQEVRSKVSSRYLIEMHIHSKRKNWFSKMKTFYSYTLYIDLGGEAQIMNLPQDTLKSSIGTMYSKETIMTYFYGVMNGFTSAQYAFGGRPSPEFKKSFLS